MSDRSPIESELAALADGSLPPERRERLLASVRSSPHLQATLAEQQRAVELIRAVDVTAPARLHERIAATRAAPALARAPKRPFALGGALGAALAAASAVIVLLLGSGSAHVPNLRQISALTLASATAPAPTENTVDNSKLAVSVQGVAFPYWGGHMGWRSTGVRVDRVAGRGVTTVFYENERHLRVGYAILAGGAPNTTGGSVTWRDGTPFRSLSVNGVPTVTWRRGGHLCVVSGRGMDDATLLALASWKGHATGV